MSDIFAEYGARRMHRNHRKTQLIYEDATEYFRAWLSDHKLPPEDVKAPDVEDYFMDSHLAPSTQRVHFMWIRAAYTYAWRRGRLSSDPTHGVKLTPLKPKVKRVIPVEALRNIRDRAENAEDWLFFHLFAYTGARRAEIGNLIWLDVNLKKAELKVTGKADRVRYIPIHPVLGELLHDAPKYKHEKPYVLVGPRGGCGEYHMDALADRMLDDKLYSLHDFRRTVATNLHSNGVVGETIDHILGWAPVSIRQRYYHVVQPEDAHAAILQLYADEPL